MRQSGRTTQQLVKCLEIAFTGQRVQYVADRKALLYTKALLEHLKRTLRVPPQVGDMVEVVPYIDNLNDRCGRKIERFYDHFLIERGYIHG